jgi:hypothetical protein
MKLRNGIPLVVGLGMIVAGTGCPLIEISADVPEVCMTYADLEVPAADGTGHMSQSFVFDDLDGIRDLTDLDAQVQFTSVKLRAKSGVSDLAFLDAARVTVASGDPASSLPALTLVDCQGDCPTIGDEVEMPADLQADAIAYVQSGSLLVDIDVAGQLPTHTWKVDVDVCFKGKIAFSHEL